MTTLDDDRRDIAVMGEESAWELNRLAHRNHGADPLEISGDAITRQRKEVAAATHANERCSRHQSQNTQKGNAMTTTNSTNIPAEKSPNWAVEDKRLQSGTDVMHLGATRYFEGVNADGSEYHFEAERAQLEEVGRGFVTDPYLVIKAGGEGTQDAVFTVDVAELGNLADWVCSLGRYAVLTRASDIKTRAVKP